MTTSKTLRHTLSKDEALNYPSPEFLGRFPAGFVTVIASKPGSGKTWFMIYNLFSLSTNYRVGAIIGDCSPVLIYDRIKRITNDCNNENIYVYFLSEIQRNNYNIDLTQSDGINHIKKLITQQNLQLIYIDTLVSLMTGDESSQKEMTPLMMSLVSLASETNCAIVVNHHLRKSGIDGNNKRITLDEVIGSSILTRLASTVITLMKSGDTIHLDYVKNWFADNTSATFKIISINGAITLTLSGSSEMKANSSTRQTIFDFIATRKSQDVLPFSDIIKIAPNLSVTSFRDIFNSLLSQGKIKDLTPDKNLTDKTIYVI